MSQEVKLRERPVRHMPWPVQNEAVSDAMLTREWLVTNGLGGYATGTVAGVPTRRYHGLLVAALPSPFGRMMMFNHLSEQVRQPDCTLARFGGEEWVGRKLELNSATVLTAFRLDGGMPIWTFKIGAHTLEKRVLLAHRLNTVYVSYRVTSGDGNLRLKLRPAVHFRPHGAHVSEPLAQTYRLTAANEQIELSAGPDLPTLRFALHGQNRAFTIEGKRLSDVLYRIEELRGYDSAGELWTPGYFRVDLSLNSSATLVASTEPWEKIHALSPDQVQEAEQQRREQLLELARVDGKDKVRAELILAADQFLIVPTGRVEDAARAHAAGDELRSVIAGYHWFTDWGRDTMISLEGLTLTTGRHQEARAILHTFARYVRHGLIPNFFPDGKNEGVYHTADATLWFFHALDRYLETTGERGSLNRLWPILKDIITEHVHGTLFGIGVDAKDGLLKQGQEGYQLTWMDAKVGDWVVTPRRGKAVEINALWYNALRLMEQWGREMDGEKGAQTYRDAADRARDSFNRRFWNPGTNYLFDVVDGENGNDPACRPNQVLAMSLRYPVLDRSHWDAVLEIVQKKLVTPVGLRSLSPDHPDFKPIYFGDLRARDAAYHQGTVWAWLVGPLIDAWLKIHPDDKAGARRWLDGFVPHLSEACIGSISEIFDARAPFTPRGCIAQAWSVAEVLRCWAKTETDGNNHQ